MEWAKIIKKGTMLEYVFSLKIWKFSLYTFSLYRLETLVLVYWDTHQLICQFHAICHPCILIEIYSTRHRELNITAIYFTWAGNFPGFLSFEAMFIAHLFQLLFNIFLVLNVKYVYVSFKSADCPPSIRPHSPYFSHHVVH